MHLDLRHSERPEGSRPRTPRWWDRAAQAASHLSDVDALRELVPDIAEQDVYLCGAEPLMDAARRAALATGVPAAQIHQERFSW